MLRFCLWFRGSFFFFLLNFYNSHHHALIPALVVSDYMSFSHFFTSYTGNIFCCLILSVSSEYLIICLYLCKKSFNLYSTLQYLHLLSRSIKSGLLCQKWGDKCEIFKNCLSLPGIHSLLSAEGTATSILSLLGRAGQGVLSCALTAWKTTAVTASSGIITSSALRSHKHYGHLRAQRSFSWHHSENNTCEHLPLSLKWKSK